MESGGRVRVRGQESVGVHGIQIWNEGDIWRGAGDGA